MNYLAQHFWNLDTNCIDGLKLWNALQTHIEKGELIVNEGKGEREGLKLVTYSKTYQYEHNSVAWDPLVQHCRGIIFDTSDTLSPYRIVALPFSKFFNYGEGGIHYPSAGAEITSVYEKVDGSLGICFHWHNKWHLTTRGSLNSDIGEVGQQMLDHMLAQQRMTLDPSDTRLFEIIYPENRICVDYGDARELVFLGRRNVRSGVEDYDIGSAVWRAPCQYQFNGREDLVNWLNKQKGEQFEGFVVHFSDGSIFKFKSEDYMRLHRIIAQFTFKRVLEAVQAGEQEDIRKALPEELIPEFDRYCWMIEDKVKKIVSQVDKAVGNAPKDSRKEFALYLQQFYKGTEIIKYAFKFLDFEMNADKLGHHILQSLHKDDFEVVENEKES
jgi:T4 RnlA family RNA ligase